MMFSESTCVCQSDVYQSKCVQHSDVHLFRVKFKPLLIPAVHICTDLVSSWKCDCSSRKCASAKVGFMEGFITWIALQSTGVSMILITLCKVCVCVCVCVRITALISVTSW